MLYQLGWSLECEWSPMTDILGLASCCGQGGYRGSPTWQGGSCPCAAPSRTWSKSGRSRSGRCRTGLMRGWRWGRKGWVHNNCPFWYEAFWWSSWWQIVIRDSLSKVHQVSSVVLWVFASFSNKADKDKEQYLPEHFRLGWSWLWTITWEKFDCFIGVGRQNKVWKRVFWLFSTISKVARRLIILFWVNWWVTRRRHNKIRQFKIICHFELPLRLK